MTIESLLNDFAENRSWDKQYRLIIRLGKQLQTLDESEKTEQNQVRGCESVAWLIIQEKSGIYTFKMDSDTRVVKGLMRILHIIFNGKTASEVAAVDCQALFSQLGILNHLSPSRANGLLAIVEKIQRLGESCEQ